MVNSQTIMPFFTKITMSHYSTIHASFIILLVFSSISAQNSMFNTSLESKVHVDS